MNLIQQSELNFEALPDWMKSLVQELHQTTKAPIELIIASILGILALSCQTRYKVRWLNGQVSPLCLWVFTIAESGERKSTVDKILTKSLREFEQEKEREYLADIAKFNQKLEVWKVKEKAINSMIRKNTMSGLPTNEEEAQAEEHAKLKPVAPKLIRLLYEDTTIQALAHSMHENISSAGLFAHEGDSILNGNAMRVLSDKTKMWDGDTITVDTKTQGSFKLINPKLSMSVMVQPSVMKKFTSRDGDMARGVGFLSRCLIGNPLSTQGRRFIGVNETNSDVQIKLFNERVLQMLNEDFSSDDDTSEIILSFGSGATARLVQIYNAVEWSMNPNEYYCDIKDHASKLVNNIARVAAILHRYENLQGEISTTTLSSAEAIMSWFSKEFYRLFSKEGQVGQEYVDASSLESFLNKFCAEHGNYRIKKNLILQYGPKELRKKDRLSMALHILSQQRKINIVPINKTYYIDFILPSNIQAHPINMQNQPQQRNYPDLLSQASIPNNAYMHNQSSMMYTTIVADKYTKPIL